MKKKKRNERVKIWKRFAGEFRTEAIPPVAVSSNTPEFSARMKNTHVQLRLHDSTHLGLRRKGVVARFLPDTARPPREEVTERLRGASSRRETGTGRRYATKSEGSERLAERHSRSSIARRKTISVDRDRIETRPANFFVTATENCQFG